MKEKSEMSVRLTILQKILKKSLGVRELKWEFEHGTFSRYTHTKFLTVGTLVIGMHKMYHGGAHLFFINCKLNDLILDLKRDDGKGRKILPDAVISLRREDRRHPILFILRPERGQDICLSSFNEKSILVYNKINKITLEIVNRENKKILKK
jgi:hypothetical protein